MAEHTLPQSRRAALFGLATGVTGAAVPALSHTATAMDPKAAMATLEAYAESMGMEAKVQFVAKGGMSDGELLDHHAAELTAVVRRLHPEVTDVKVMAAVGVLRYGLLAFT